MKKTKMLSLLPACLGLALLSALLLYALATPSFPRGVFLPALICAVPGMVLLLTSLASLFKSFKKSG